MMTIREQLTFIAKNRIIILDGAMGSIIRSLNPGEPCIDNLCLTNPQVIAGIHDLYLEAGADIISTCSFNSTSISLSDYGLGSKAYEISAAAAQIARESAKKFSTSDKPRFIAGSIGPTAKGASLFSDINNPCKHSINWDELETAYYDNARGLLDGGADILLVETVFDTLNAKAALFSINRLMIERQIDIPVIISAAVSCIVNNGIVNNGIASNDIAYNEKAGRLLSGQSLEAFCTSISHINPLAIGINCSFDAQTILPLVRTVSKISPCLVIAYPNAGLPNNQGIYKETPQTMTAKIEEYFKENLVNIIGGCCGSTPAHIEAIAKKAAGYKPRLLSCTIRSEKQGITLSGLEPLYLDGNSINISAMTNPKNSEDLRQALAAGEYEDAADIARDIIEGDSGLNGAPVLCIEIDDSQALSKFLDYALLNPYIAKAPFYIKSSGFDVIKTGLKRLQGKGLAGPVNNIDEARQIIRYGAVPVVTTKNELDNCPEAIIVI